MGRRVLVACGFLFLVACGGGGGSGASPPVTTVVTPPVATPATPTTPATAAITPANASEAGELAVAASERLLQLAQDAVEITQYMEGFRRNFVTINVVRLDCMFFSDYPSTLTRPPIVRTIEVGFTDVDGDRLISPGDRLTAVYRNCARTALMTELNGTLDIEVVAPAADDPAGTSRYAGIVRTSNLTVDEGGQSVPVSGAFRYASGESRSSWRLEATAAAPGLELDVFATARRMTATLRNFRAAKEIDFIGARIRSTLSGEMSSARIGGTVVVTTPDVLTSPFSTFPERGRINLEGTGRGLVAVRAVSANDASLRVDYDLDGNGSMDGNAAVEAAPGKRGFLFWNARLSQSRGIPIGFKIGPAGERPFRIMLVDPPFAGSVLVRQRGTYFFQFSEPVDAARLASSTLEAVTPVSVVPRVPLQNDVVGAQVELHASADLSPGVRYRVRAPITFTATSGASLVYTIPTDMMAENRVVAVTAASPAVARLGDTVTLSAAGSVVKSGTLTRRRWLQVAGPAVVLGASDAAATSFVVPAGTPNDTRLTFRLELTSSEGVVDADDVTVIVMNDRDSVPFLGYSFLEETIRGSASQATELLRADAGTFAATQPSPTRLDFAFSSTTGPARSFQWSFQLAAGDVLAPGTYAPRAAGFPSLAVTTDGFSCLPVEGPGPGAVQIHELAVDGAGKVTRAAIDFRATCNNLNDPPLAGSLRIGSTWPLP